MNAPARQSIQCGYGKINLKTTIATFAALRVKPAFERESAVSTGLRAPNTMQVTPVSRFPHINGNMWRDTVSHEPGTILMLQASWKRAGVPIRDGAILLKLRPHAAMLNVVATLPHGPDSLIGDKFSMFTGNADILSVDEAAIHGIHVPRRYVDQFFDLEQVEECFDITQISPEVAPAPQVALVATAQGVVYQEIAQAPTRRMRFRKG